MHIYYTIVIQQLTAQFLLLNKQKEPENGMGYLMTLQEYLKYMDILINCTKFNSHKVVFCMDSYPWNR